MNEKQVKNGVKRAVQEVCRAKRVKDSDSLVLDLGFDSLKIASLVMSLEEEFGQPILVNDWIGQVHDPTELTVGSLNAYIYQLLCHEP